MAMALSRFLLLVVPHLFLSSFHQESAAATAMDVPSSSSSLPPDKEQLAVMMNLSSFVGDGWASATDMCDWTGVACSRSRSGSYMVVTNITLSSYAISDPKIFSPLCLLDTLLSLDLSMNFFTNLGDEFSSASCRMKEGLVSLNLSHNQLSQPDLGSSDQLAILDLSYNNLSGAVPYSLWSLPSLTQLVLSYNNLSGFVPMPRQDLHVDIAGNPYLVVTGTGSNNDHTRKITAHIVVVIVCVASAHVGLCFVLLCVGAMVPSPNRTYHVDNDNVVVPPWEDDESQATNGGLTAMCCCWRTCATMLTKEKQQNAWRITAFQALNFEAADILRGLTAENLVGSGGSGHVYRVPYKNRHDRSVVGVVAVKQIPVFGTSSSPDELFESEARILCGIRHNNIVRLLCCLSGAESKLLVYDYMDNGSLDRWLHGDYVLRARHPTARARPVRRVPLDWPTRLVAAVGAAQGLCYMHHHCSPPIIHRDVKTSNILLDAEFRGKVADFGLARMLMQAGEPNTMTWVVGSFGYMAPEYAYTRRVNEKVDVFGFGVVLLELTTDRNANDGGDHGSLAEWAGHQYRSGASIATDICVGYAGYADEIETVFRLGVKCTASSPSSRPTMAEALQILLRCGEQTLRKSRLECGTE